MPLRSAGETKVRKVATNNLRAWDSQELTWSSQIYFLKASTKFLGLLTGK